MARLPRGKTGRISNRVEYKQAVWQASLPSPVHVSGLYSNRIPGGLPKSEGEKKEKADFFWEAC
jgi:hypothetical protein